MKEFGCEARILVQLIKMTLNIEFGNHISGSRLIYVGY